MEAITQTIRINYVDKGLNTVISKLTPSPSLPVSRHYNQHEEFFLKLEREFDVYAFPIHHDVDRVTPEPAYLSSLQAVLFQLFEQVPELFAGTTYYFDPADTLRPSFFRVFSLNRRLYLYLLQLDFNQHFQEGRLITKGNNDITPHYKTRHLYLEAVILPLDTMHRTDEHRYIFTIKQILSDTWIGEEGRGYFAKGIWIDNEITKFLSRLFLPAGQKHYPYFPFLCRYKTIARAIIQFSTAELEQALPYLDKAIHFLIPEVHSIQQELKNRPFSEELETFRSLKNRLGAEWTDFLTTFNIETYLNEQGMKEFRIDI